MNIIKQAGGNVVLTDSAGNILKSFINVNALDIVSDNEIIIKFGYNQWHSIFASVLQFTQVEPAAAVAWSGDAYALAAILSLDFFYVASGSGPCPPNLTTAKLMKTGQTTSFRTGDDGDLQAGRDVDFLTLAENNVYGNTNRFTDELGGQTYTLNIVIDWSTYNGSTVLGWFRLRGTYNDIIWASAIDNSILFTQGAFLTGWRLPNINEILSLKNNGTIRPLNYAPFNFNNNLNFWSSTTNPATTTNAIVFQNQNPDNILDRSKTNTSTQYRAMPCRTFTVIGTILT